MIGIVLVILVITVIDTHTQVRNLSVQHSTASAFSTQLKHRTELNFSNIGISTAAVYTTQL